MFLPFQDDNPSRRTPLVTYTLIAINILVFVWATYLLPAPEQEKLLLRRGFIPRRVSQLWDPVSVIVPRDTAVQHPFFGRNVILRRQFVLPPNRSQIVLSPFTSMFMHGGWLHLIFNMWFLWIFGAKVEDRLGRVIFPIFYIIGGLLATGLHWVSDPGSLIPVVGASGAVATVLGAYAITWPFARIQTLVFLVFIFFDVEIPALVFLGGWFIVQLLSGLQDAAGGVAWWAHIGGFVVGLLFMPILCDLLEDLSEDQAEGKEDGRTENDGVDAE
ncbi:MAG: rhomboid family intramembrane serine protease [Pirellulales bacterium]|nr:rhomboid family intramembrane serine protease [Pirellulales bacterium]